MTPEGPAGTPRRLGGVQALMQMAVMIVGVTALLAISFAALGISPARGLVSLGHGVFGDAQHGHLYALSETLVKTCPLLLTALGVTVAWRAGLFSIGGEGQLIIGATAATAVGVCLPRAPGPVLSGAMLLVGVAAGAMWGAIAGWLRVARGVHEVISTIMLNYVGLYLLGWAVRGPLQEGARRVAESNAIRASALLARLIPPAWTNGVATRLHSGVLFALAAVVVVQVLLYRTPLGFDMRLIGFNPEAGRTVKIPVDRVRLWAMAISGGLCGLAGVVELLGVTGRLYSDFSPGWGYTAIPVALLGGLHPAGVLVSALFFGALQAGGGNLARFSGVSSVLVYVVQGVAVLAVVGMQAWRARRAEGGAAVMQA